MAQPNGTLSSSTSIVSEYSLFHGSDIGCRSTLPDIDYYTDHCLKWMDNSKGASVGSFFCSSFEPEEEEEEVKEREHKPAALRLTIVGLHTAIPATQIPSLTLRAAACSASTYARNGDDMNINIDAWLLQSIFGESLKTMDQLQ